MIKSPVAVVTFVKRYLWLLGGLIFIVVGLTLSLPQFIQTVESNDVPKVAVSPFSHPQPVPTAPEFTNTEVQGIPVWISIPGVNINVPVIKGYHNLAAQTWTLTTYAAQYAVNTPAANNVEGNTFIYGHNRKSVFESLLKIKLGDTAYLYTDNGHELEYTFQGALITTPSDDSLFKYQGPPILTLQTCSGEFYQNRQLFTFNLTKVIK